MRLLLQSSRAERVVRAGLAAGFRRAWSPALGSSAVRDADEIRGRSDAADVAKPRSDLARPRDDIGGRRGYSSSSLASLLSPRAPPLTLDTINSLVRECEYAVRGEIVARALMLESQLAAKPGTLPFNEIIYCNIGNPQALGQPPITFYREVLALCDHPSLLHVKNPDGSSPFSATARQRAQQMLDSIPCAATGAYSHSQGLPLCRQVVAEGIAQRDGHAASADDIFLTDGASPAVQMILKLLVRSKADGVLCPIPQYPLYSASLALNGGTLVPYYLDEGARWRLDPAHLQTAVEKAGEEGVCVRALCVINPGNPTGQVLEEADQQAIVRFCVDKGLVLIADEVYQENVYAPDRRFLSFKKVARDMGVGASDLALISCHSSSKGFYGECGRRGGYMEVTGNWDYLSDVAFGLPSEEGDDAFPVFAAERDAILSSLARRAKLLVDVLNSLPGITCNPSEGAMYAFPRLHLPPRAVEAAAAVGMLADTFYARRLLDATGIVVVPGSGFGQEPGTWHVRFTILPSEDKISGMMERFAEFHDRFMREFTV
ncbi:unnamed protein product [Closterium sp. NIES-65]|nr:unnamed protein product [Closterium sp. NIES-65]